MKTIGIDIGGTQTRIAVFSGKKLLAQTRFVTNSENPEAHVQHMAAEIKKLTTEYAAIGIACPGPLDLKAGVVLNPPNLLGWHNFPLAARMQEIMNVPVKIENDANLAALAEALVGAGNGQPIVQFITVSTGVGAGLVINGTIFQGAQGFAQEVANCLVDETCLVAGNTLPGSVERICSGTGIYQLARQRGLAVESTADVFRLAGEGASEAQAIIEYVGSQLAKFLAMLQAVIDPSVIVLGGSVALYNPQFVAMLTDQIKACVYPNVAPYVHVVTAELGDDAGVIGAGLLANKIACKEEESQ
ncbi:MAG: ROK family protein [Culicoidibacterales bacterium]